MHSQHLRLRNNQLSVVFISYLRMNDRFQRVLLQTLQRMSNRSITSVLKSFTSKLQKCLANAQLVSIELIFELVITNVCESNVEDKSKQNAD